MNESVTKYKILIEWFINNAKLNAWSGELDIDGVRLMEIAMALEPNRIKQVKETLEKEQEDEEKNENIGCS